MIVLSVVPKGIVHPEMILLTHPQAILGVYDFLSAEHNLMSIK